MTKKIKGNSLTPWFPADVKPVHVGVYETALITDFGHKFFGYSLFNGRVWGNQRHTPERAEEYPGTHGHNKEWRGLANPPKETKQKGEK